MKRNFFKIFVLLVLVFLAGFGCQSNNDKPQISSVAVSSYKTSSDNISITSPLPESTVANPVYVTGQARVFENVVSWRLRDNQGAEIATGTTEAAAPDMGQFGPFAFWLVVPATNSPTVTLEVFQASAKDGSDQDIVSFPIKMNTTETSTLKLYFHNDQLDPEITCTEVFPVNRVIVKTEAPARAVVVALLNGPVTAEQSFGYYSAVPFRSFLKDISLSPEGLIKVDLGGVITAPLGGSCLVGAIGAEIEETLKQFSSVKTVQILLNGQKDALQP